jgi:hypothetical protein
MFFNRHLSRGVLYTCVLIVLLIGGFGEPPAGAQPMGQAGVCSTNYCAYLPQIAKPLPIQVACTYSGQWGKGLVQVFTGGLTLTGSQPVYNVTLESRFYNATNQLIRTEVITPAMPATLPGQLNRFFVYEPFNETPARFEIRVRSFSTSSSSTYKPVTVLSAQLIEVESFHVVVRGSVRNDQPSTLKQIVLLVGSSQCITEYRTVVIPSLAPGQTAPFEADFGFYAEPAPPLHVEGLGVVEP